MTEYRGEEERGEGRRRGEGGGEERGGEREEIEISD